MELFDRIPVVLDAVEIAARLRFDPERAGFGSLDELMALVQDLVRPRGVLRGRVRRGERGGDRRSVGYRVRKPRPPQEPRNDQQGLSLHHHGRVRSSSAPPAPRRTCLSNTTSRRWRTSLSRKPPLGSSARLEERYGFGPLSSHEPRLARGLAHHRAGEALLASSAIPSAWSACG